MVAGLAGVGPVRARAELVRIASLVSAVARTAATGAGAGAVPVAVVGAVGWGRRWLRLGGGPGRVAVAPVMTRLIG